MFQTFVTYFKTKKSSLESETQNAMLLV